MEGQNLRFGNVDCGIFISWNIATNVVFMNTHFKIFTELQFSSGQTTLTKGPTSNTQSPLFPLTQDGRGLCGEKKKRGLQIPHLMKTQISITEKLLYF